MIKYLWQNWDELLVALFVTAFVIRMIFLMFGV